MPRRTRPDIEPEILVPNVSVPQRLANEAIDDLHSAKVHRRGEPPIRDGWMIVVDELERRLNLFRNRKTLIPTSFLYFLIAHCEMAHASPKLDADGQPETQDGNDVMILRRVGCRVRMTERQMADSFNRSVSTIERYVSTLKEHGFIVNSGHGWIELDASLCWRGNLTFHRAYREVQRVRDGFEITDGTTTLITEDMDDCDVVISGEHPPPRCAGQGGEIND
jgi:hypothetical protein